MPMPKLIAAELPTDLIGIDYMAAALCLHASDVVPEGRLITMGVGCWDALLQHTYDAGWYLLEVDESGKAIRGWQKRILH